MNGMNFDHPNWAPLERGEVEFYKHIRRRRSLRLEASGGCYQQGPQGLEPASLNEELKRVFG